MRVFSAAMGLVFILSGIGIYAYYDTLVKPEKEAKELLIQGKVAFEKAHARKDEISNALDKLSKVIAKYPTTEAAVEAYFYIGYGYEKLGLKRLAYLKYVYALKNNAKRSRSIFNQVRNSDADYDAIDGEIRARIAKLTLSKNYSTEGIHQLMDIIGTSSSKNFRSRGYAEIGHTYLKNGSTSKARSMFDIALREDGDNEDALLGKAGALYKLGRFNSAFSTYEYYFRYYSDYSPYYKDVKNSYIRKVFWRGESNFKRKKYRTAISYFNRLLRTFPNTSKTERAKYLIAESYLGMKKYKTAIKHYDTVLLNSDNKNDQEALFKKGYTYFMAKRYDLAAREFQKYIDAYPGGRYISRAKKWKEEAKKEILYRIQMRKVPDMDYDIDELEEDEGIEEDYKKYKNLEKKSMQPVKKKKDITYERTKEMEKEMEMYRKMQEEQNKKLKKREDDYEDYEELERRGFLEKIGKIKNYFMDNDSKRKKKKNYGVKGKIKKYIDKLVKKENVAEL